MVLNRFSFPRHPLTDTYLPIFYKSRLADLILARHLPNQPNQPDKPDKPEKPDKPNYPFPVKPVLGKSIKKKIGKRK
jgi:hypothetical protein